MVIGPSMIGAVRADEQRVAVRRRARDIVAGDRAAGAGAVLDDDRLAERIADAGLQDARADVDVAAGAHRAPRSVIGFGRELLRRRMARASAASRIVPSSQRRARMMSSGLEFVANLRSGESRRAGSRRPDARQKPFTTSRTCSTSGGPSKVCADELAPLLPVGAAVEILGVVLDRLPGQEQPVAATASRPSAAATWPCSPWRA